VTILARTPVFAGLSRRLLSRLAVQLFEKAYAPGEAVFSEGDPGKGLFIVLDGEIEVVRDAGQGPQRIVTFGPGTAFGELALIDDLPRSAGALATVPSRLHILYRSHFEDLVAGDRAIALMVSRSLCVSAGYVRGQHARRAERQPPAPSPAPLPRPPGERRRRRPSHRTRRGPDRRGAFPDNCAAPPAAASLRSAGWRSPAPSLEWASCSAVSSSPSPSPPCSRTS
jgi:CRP-like cAMP-binding protein